VFWYPTESLTQVFVGLFRAGHSGGTDLVVVAIVPAKLLIPAGKLGMLVMIYIIKTRNLIKDMLPIQSLYVYVLHQLNMILGSLSLPSHHIEWLDEPALVG